MTRPSPGASLASEQVVEGQSHGIADRDCARTRDVRVECQAAAEAAADVAQHFGIAFEGVGVDCCHRAPGPERIETHNQAADVQLRARPVPHGEPIDAALSDLNMPEMDGFEFCRQLRAQCKERNQDVPVWIMTGLFSPALEKRATAAGAMLVLRKPFPIEDVCRQLEAEFQKRAEAASGEPPSTKTDSELSN